MRGSSRCYSGMAPGAPLAERAGAQALPRDGRYGGWRYIEVALPQLREEPEPQRLGKVRHTRRTAGAGLVADNALDGLHVLEAPELKAMIQINQPFGKLVQIAVLIGIVIDA